MRKIEEMNRYFVILVLCGFFSVLSGQEQVLTEPADYFGFEPGTDRKLFDYEELTGYMQKLADESPRIRMEEIGKSPMAVSYTHLTLPTKRIV